MKLGIAETENLRETDLRIFASDVWISSALGIDPGHRAHATRIVRHNLADVLAWLGDSDPGPLPWHVAHAVYSPFTAQFWVSTHLYSVLVNLFWSPKPYMPGLTAALVDLNGLRSRCLASHSPEVLWSSPEKVVAWAAAD